MAGNANSGPKREKPFRDALLMEIKAAGEDHKTLRRIARAVISKAEDGDIQAIKEIADRLDGKVPQSLEGGDPDKPVRLWVGWMTQNSSQSSHILLATTFFLFTTATNDGASSWPIAVRGKPLPASMT